MVNTLVRRAAVVAVLILGAASSALATAGNPNPIPEPSLLVLLAGAAGGAILYSRSRRARK